MPIETCSTSGRSLRWLDLLFIPFCLLAACDRVGSRPQRAEMEVPTDNSKHETDASIEFGFFLEDPTQERLNHLLTSAKGRELVKQALHDHTLRYHEVSTPPREPYLLVFEVNVEKVDARSADGSGDLVRSSRSRILCIDDRAMIEWARAHGQGR